MPEVKTPVLESIDIQAIVLSSLVHLRFSSYLFLHLEDKENARRWLAQIIPQITHARWEVDAEGRRRKPGAAVNIAFTCPGLATIGLAQESLTSFSQEFNQGIAQPDRSRRLGDTGESAPENWEIGGRQTPEEEIHALLIVQAGSEAALTDLRQTHLELAGSLGVRLVGRPQEGQLPDDGREHFGYADGIAEPNIEGSPKPPGDGQSCIKAGEFILGYPNEYDNLPTTPHVRSEADLYDNLAPLKRTSDIATGAQLKDFGRNGTYLVFRKLQQDVAAFRRYLQAICPEVTARDRMAAKLVGRWPSGTPLVLHPETDPFARDSERARTNAFCYMETDPEGLRCPIGAHTRRVNPRDSLGDETTESIRSVNRHRLLRRGVPYGPKLAPEIVEDDGTPRGVLFFCINTDIKRQFEFVQQTWINNSKFNGLYNDKDPLLGDNDGRGELTIPGIPVRQRLTGVPRFVTVKGGGYFFLPGIAALCFLAGIENPWRRHEARFRAPRGGQSQGRSQERPAARKLGQESVPPGEQGAMQQVERLVRQGFERDYGSGARPALRGQHAKAQGCVKAEFTVSGDLPEQLQYGLFKEPRTYPALIRFSTSSAHVQSDTKRDVHGMAIKLLGVEGEKLLEQERDATTHDFLMVNSKPFFIRNALDYVPFFSAAAKGKMLSFFIGWNPARWHLHELWCLWVDVRNRVDNPLQVQYWSQTPYRLGPGAMKFTAKPRAVVPDHRPGSRGPDYLRAAMAEQLANGDVYFDFLVQLQTDPETMPIEDPTIVWDERLSPFQRVASIRIPSQVFDSPDWMAFAENLSFTPWHALTDHRPLGGINRTRRTVYETISRLRREMNGVPRTEPSSYEVS
jgi:Dyp-type peroxidase family